MCPPFQGRDDVPPTGIQFVAGGVCMPYIIQTADPDEDKDDEDKDSTTTGEAAGASRS